MDTNHPTNAAPALFVAHVPAMSGLPSFGAAHPSLSPPVIAAPLLTRGLPDPHTPELKACQVLLPMALVITCFGDSKCQGPAARSAAPARCGQGG